MDDYSWFDDFDASSVGNFDLSGLDLGGLDFDLGGLDLGGADLGGFDLGEFDVGELDLSDLSDISIDDVAQAVPAAIFDVPPEISLPDGAYETELSRLFDTEGGADVSQLVPPDGAYEAEISRLFGTDGGVSGGADERVLDMGGGAGFLTTPELERERVLDLGGGAGFETPDEYTARQVEEYRRLGLMPDNTAQYKTDAAGNIVNSGYDRPGGYTSQWQTTPSGERVLVNDDGTGVAVRLNKDGSIATTRGLSTADISGMVKAGQINTAKSGYFDATGGSKIAPGGGISTTTKDGTPVVLKTDGTVMERDTGRTITNTEVIKEVIDNIRNTGGTGGVTTQPGGGGGGGGGGTRPGTTPSTQQSDMLKLLLPFLLMMAMREKGSAPASSAVIPALTATQKQTPYGQIQQAPGYRPGQGGIRYFEPVQYAPRMARGGIIDLARALAAKRREQRLGLLKGRGDGTSDSIPAMIGSEQPARLARGEYVVDARTVAELGNGSTDAGAERLDEMRKRVHAKRKKANVGQDSKAYKELPA